MINRFAPCSLGAVHAALGVTVGLLLSVTAAINKEKSKWP